MKEGYLPKDQRKKILFLCDDIRMHSGVATMAREIVVGTCHKYNWVNVGAAINHPEVGKKLDLSQDTGNRAGVEDASVFLYPQNGYGDANILRQYLKAEKPDAIMIFTDPRYWEWLFQIENEIRSICPLIYLNIWDDLPAPMYNKAYYESCDTLLAISKQTETTIRTYFQMRFSKQIETFLQSEIHMLIPSKSSKGTSTTAFRANRNNAPTMNSDVVSKPTQNIS